MLPPTLFPLLIPILLILVAAVSPARAAPFSQLGLVSSFQSNIAASLSAWLAPSQPANSDKRFTLKHAVHQGTTRYRGLSARADFPPSVSTSSLNAHTIRTVRQRITRAKDPKAYLLARGTSLEQAQCASEQAVEWQDVDVEAPDTSHRETLLALAKMTSQAYDNDTSGWEPGYGGWNLSDSFGWAEDGIRGHIFTTEDNSTIVVALKGTSAGLLPGGGDTAKRDKLNDNLLFSCCCARVSWSWPTVCDCYAGHGSSCGQTCLERALVEKSVYYPATTDLYNNISYMYPDANIWITGHSLGGALAALLGTTFGVPTVSFEAPGERMAAQRLHLPLPPPKNPKHSPLAELPITHVYHTADPIAMGECTGAASLCASAGYAMESKCHAGKTILYDTTGKLGWASSINSHRITTLVDTLLVEDWDKLVGKKNGDKASASWNWWPWGGGHGSDKDEKLGPVPPRESEDGCKDCSDWKFSDRDQETE